MSTTPRERTTVEISKNLHRRLKKLKPYDSVSYNDLIAEMADTWEDNHR